MSKAKPANKTKPKAKPQVWLMKTEPESFGIADLRA